MGSKKSKDSEKPKDQASEPAEPKSEPKAETKKPKIDKAEKPSRLHGKKPVKSPPPPEHAQVPLRVYMRISGQKWDQIAGFVAHAKAQKLGPMSVEAWREEYKKFMSSPA